MPGTLKATVNGDAACGQCKVTVKPAVGSSLTFTCNNPPCPWVLLTSLNAGTWTVSAVCQANLGCTASQTGVKIVNGQIKSIILTMSCKGGGSPQARQACKGEGGMPPRPNGQPVDLRVLGNVDCEQVSVFIHEPAIHTTGPAVHPDQETAVYGPFKTTRKDPDGFWYFDPPLTLANGKRYRVIAICDAQPPRCRTCGCVCFADSIVKPTGHEDEIRLYL
jgi:hypothetical protein